MQKKESAGSIIWRLIYPLLAFLGAEFVVEVVVIAYKMMDLMSSNPQLLEDVEGLTGMLTDYVTAQSLYITIARTVILVPIYYLFMRHDVKVDKKYGRYCEYTPLDKRYLLLLPVVGFAAALGFNHLVMYGLLVLQAALQAIFGNGVNLFSSFNEVSEVIYSGTIPVQIIATAVAAPLCEEFLFRAMIFKRLRGVLKFMPSAIISAVIFGLFHGNVVQFVYAFIIGLMFAWVYEKYQTIWAPVIFHAGANFIAVMVQLITGDGDLGVGTGWYVLITVAELAITYAIMRLIKVKVNREKIIADGEEDLRNEL